MSTPPVSSRTNMRTLSVDLPESVVQKLGRTTQEATRHLAELAFVELFRQGEVSSGWAARQLGIGKDDFIRLLAKHQVPYIDLSEEELRQQLEAAMPFREPTDALIVSDASPLISLSRAGRLDLLPAIYRHVVIPPAVRDDAIRRGVSPAEIDRAGWLSVTAPRDASMVEQLLHVEELDPGESEAIVLAIQLGLRLLIDERRGHRVAREHGIVVTGVVGVVLAACRMRIIRADEVEPLLRRMDAAQFWLSESLIHHAVALARAGG